MAETNESENTLNQNPPGHNDASKTTVPPVRDPLSLRDTDTGNLKRLTPGQAKKTIKLKPLTAKSTTTLPAVGAVTPEEAPAAQPIEGAAAPAPIPMIKLKPVATAAAPSPLTAKSSAATIKITPKMKTGETESAEAEPGSQTIKLNTVTPAADAKPASSGSAVLRPVGSATAGGLKPVISGTEAAPGVKLTAVKPGTASGLKPVSSGSAVLRPVGAATAGGLKPVMPGATASGLKPVIKTATASGLKPVAAPAPVEPATEAPAAEAIPAPKKLSISKPVAPASAPEAEVESGAESESPAVKPALSIPKKEAGLQATTGNTSGLKLKNDEDKVQAEKEKFEKLEQEMTGGKEIKLGETASADKVEPGIMLSLCNLVAMVMLIASLTLVTVQFLNHWQNKNIKLPGLENIADNPIGIKTPAAATTAPAAPAATTPKAKAAKK